jgi:SAM-dependent methyltransferase
MNCEDEVDPDLDRYLTANRELWEEWTPIHETSSFYDLPGFVRRFQAGRDGLRGFEVSEMGDVTGKTLLHLMCHLGTDTLSWARRGAEVTGVDASTRSIAVARSLANQLQLEAEFIEADVYKIESRLTKKFDIVYASHGVLGWLPELKTWGKIIGELLASGGIFYIAEIHPFPLLFGRHGKDHEALELQYRYFPRDEPLELSVTGSYVDRTAVVDAKVQYRWPHSIGELISAVADAGLHIQFVHEFPFMVYQGLSFLERRDDGLWWIPNGMAVDLPLSLSLRAVKESSRPLPHR